MMATRILIKRNIKLFFKDKGLFLVSLITPVILLVLYIVFLGDIYRDSFLMHIPQGFSVDEKIVDGLVACQLMSSILGVSCITVAFCSNMLMVQDRANGSIKDFTISPIKPSTLAISYYVSNIVTTLMVCLSALEVCLVYVAFVFIGAVAEIGIVWLIADCFNALMALPNLIALTALSKVVIESTKQHFESKKLSIKTK